MQENKQMLSRQIIAEDQFSMDYLSPGMLEQILVWFFESVGENAG